MTDSDSDRLIDVCYFLPTTRSLAIVERVGDLETVPLADDCSGPYSHTAILFPVRVLAVVAGEPVPESVTLVDVPDVYFTSFVDSDLRQVGDMSLVSLHEIDGEWFVGPNVKVVLDQDEELPERRDVIFDLPSSFEDLSAEAMEKLANYEQFCRPDRPIRLPERELRKRYKVPPADCTPRTGEPEPCTDPDCEGYVPPDCEDGTDRPCE